MRGPHRSDTLVIALAGAGLLAGCAGSAPDTMPQPSAAPASQSPVRTPAPPAARTAEPAERSAATPGVAVTTGMVYETADPRLPDQDLDVYAPAEGGPHPVAVMLHGGPGVIDKEWTAGWAQLVAEDGWVVFAPTWGVGGPEALALPMHEKVEAFYRQAACSIAFARAHATDYGGDPSSIVLVGHSAGANAAATIVFNDLAPSEGCPGGDAVGPVTSIVTYEGDWLFHDTMWDSVVRDDPQVLTTGLPWVGLSAHPDVPVVMLVSNGSGGVVDVPAGDPRVDSWATDRDPVMLRGQFMTSGPDGTRIDVAQSQAVLAAALEAQGNRVSLTEVPGADHMTIGMRGRPTLLAALRAALGE